MLQLRRHRRDRKGGQILVLFALVLVVILAFSALVIDVGLLRNNRNTLLNAMDAGALAGGTLLPVDGSLPNGQGAANAAAIRARIIKTVSATYPGLVEGPTGDYQIEYRCMIGADPVSGAPLISRDIPIVCNPSHAVGPTVTASDFIGAGPTRNSACDPIAGDKCNVVQLSGAITTAFSFGRAVGVNSGSTGLHRVRRVQRAVRRAAVQAIGRRRHHRPLREHGWRRTEPPRCGVGRPQGL